MNKYYNNKKLKQLYTVYGKRWDVKVVYKITICTHDTENILKCNEKLIDKNLVCMKRITKKMKLFNRFVYFNKLYGGEVK